METSQKLIDELKRQLRKEIMQELTQDIKKDITKNQRKMINKAFAENEAISLDLYGQFHYGESNFYYTMYIAYSKDFNSAEEMQKALKTELDEIMKTHNMIEFI